MLKKGDWVEARTITAHSVVGYIERMVCDEQQALIRVIRSCCARVGDLEWADTDEVDLLRDTNISDTEGYLLNMIDFALDIRDRNEFIKRTYELRRLRDSKLHRREPQYIIFGL